MIRAIPVLAGAFLLLLPLSAQGQNSSSPSAAPSQQLLKAEELDALVAPIALYPDTLLSQVLMASTYPLEVVQAERWLESKNFKGDRLKSEAEKQPWDDSVKSLLATPSVLSMMSTKLDWTQKLGDAVLAQQSDVMDAIQRLRSKAHANNKLISTKEQKVTLTQEDNRQIIAIEPADPDTVYVPYYDPAVVYGGWPYSDYPPYYFPAPDYIASGIIATGIAFGAGYALRRWASAGRFWGGRINWSGGRGEININRGTRVSHWQHNPQHRRGVRYTNTSVAQRFGNTAIRAGSKERPDSRHRQQALKPGADRANLAERGRASRPSPGNRGGGKQISQAKRPSSHPNRPSRERATANLASGRAAARQPQHRRASLGGGQRRSFAYSAPRGGAHAAARGFGGGRAGRRGGRRSDIRLKHDVILLGHLGNGLGYYRFTYNGGDRAYVGVMAQEVQTIMPEAVVRGRDGYLRVLYDKLGLKFETYEGWIASGARIPATDGIQH